MGNNLAIRRSCLRKAHGLANLTVLAWSWPGYLRYVPSPIIKRFCAHWIMFPALSFVVVVHWPWKAQKYYKSMVVRLLIFCVAPHSGLMCLIGRHPISFYKKNGTQVSMCA